MPLNQIKHLIKRYHGLAGTMNACDYLSKQGMSFPVLFTCFPTGQQSTKEVSNSLLKTQ